MPIQVRLLVFAPDVGQELEAKVARHGSDHLALLAYGVINVTIPYSLSTKIATRKNFPGSESPSTNLPAHTSGEAERGGSLGTPTLGAGLGGAEVPDNLPPVGARVRFVVRAMHVDDGLLTILGEMSSDAE